MDGATYQRVLHQVVEDFNDRYRPLVINYSQLLPNQSIEEILEPYSSLDMFQEEEWRYIQEDSPNRNIIDRIQFSQVGSVLMLSVWFNGERLVEDKQLESHYDDYDDIDDESTLYDMLWEDYFTIDESNPFDF